MTHVNIDGDVICYSVGFAAEQTRYRTIDGKLFDDEENANIYLEKYGDVLDAEYNEYDEETGALVYDYGVREYTKIIVPEPIEFVLSTAKRMIANIVESCEADTYTVLLTGSGNFREEAASIQPYKGNREDARKPEHYAAIREYLLTHQNGEIVDGEEADDQLSIRAELFGDIIATVDKDLDNTAGVHYNWRKHRLYSVSEHEADVNFHCQLLTGDATDNIPGLYRLTGKRATANMKKSVAACTTAREMFDTVFDIYMECSDDSEATVASWLNEIGTLLWMRREPGENYVGGMGYE